MKIFHYVQKNLKSLVLKLSIRHQEQKSPQVKEENIMFMTFIIRVNLLQPDWHKALSRILKTTDVRAFKMDQDGIAEVSGFADPDVLLKTVEKQGKRAELCWFQYGKCSSNLFGPSGKDVKGVPRPQAKSSSDKSASAVNAQAPPTGNVTTTTAKN